MADAEQKRSSGTYSAPALEKGFDVVELLATAPEGLTASEIAAGLGLSISKIFRMIVVMEQRGWLTKDQSSDRYRVTYKVLDLAFRATPLQELAAVATPLMQALAQASEQSCHLAVRDGDRALIVLRQESPGPIGFSVRLGTPVDLVASSSGHVLLAFGDAGQVDAILDRADFPQHLTAEALHAMLSQVRARGCEAMESARVAGVRDLSCPVFGFDGRVAAALTIPFLTFIDSSQHVSLEEAKALLRDTARQISQGLGAAASAS